MTQHHKTTTNYSLHTHIRIRSIIKSPPPLNQHNLYLPHPSPAHTPLDTPKNTHTTHLPTSRCNLGIKTPTPNTPDLTDIRIDYQSNIMTYTHTHTHTHTATHIYTQHAHIHIAKKHTHRNYQPCLPQRHYGFHILCFPLLTVQNTTCSRTWSYSPDDGCNDTRIMLR